MNAIPGTILVASLFIAGWLAMTVFSHAEVSSPPEDNSPLVTTLGTPDPVFHVGGEYVMRVPDWLTVELPDLPTMAGMLLATRQGKSAVYGCDGDVYGARKGHSGFRRGPCQSRGNGIQKRSRLGKNMAVRPHQRPRFSKGSTCMGIE
jgi:hypothetical protein